MFCISLHILPEHSRQFDREELLQKVRALRSPEVDAYEEKNQFHLAFHFFTEFPSELWAQLSRPLFQDAEYSKKLSAICIVTCEGEEEDDYWLLYHPDKSQQLDKLP
jgi:hypothetical protein